MFRERGRRVRVSACIVLPPSANFRGGVRSREESAGRSLLWTEVCCNEVRSRRDRRAEASARGGPQLVSARGVLSAGFVPSSVRTHVRPPSARLRAVSVQQASLRIARCRRTPVSPAPPIKKHPTSKGRVPNGSVVFASPHVQDRACANCAAAGKRPSKMRFPTLPWRPRDASSP